jgi:hypothetical protein
MTRSSANTAAIKSADARSVIFLTLSTESGVSVTKKINAHSRKKHAELIFLEEGVVCSLVCTESGISVETEQTIHIKIAGNAKPINLIHIITKGTVDYYLTDFNHDGSIFVDAKNINIRRPVKSNGALIIRTPSTPNNIVSFETDCDFKHGHITTYKFQIIDKLVTFGKLNLHVTKMAASSSAELVINNLTEENERLTQSYPDVFRTTFYNLMKRERSIVSCDEFNTKGKFSFTKVFCRIVSLTVWQKIELNESVVNVKRKLVIKGDGALVAKNSRVNTRYLSNRNSMFCLSSFIKVSRFAELNAISKTDLIGTTIECGDSRIDGKVNALPLKIEQADKQKDSTHKTEMKSQILNIGNYARHMKFVYSAQTNDEEIQDLIEDRNEHFEYVAANRVKTLKEENETEIPPFKLLFERLIRTIDITRLTLTSKMLLAGLLQQKREYVAEIIINIYERYYDEMDENLHVNEREFYSFIEEFLFINDQKSIIRFFVRYIDNSDSFCQIAKTIAQCMEIALSKRDITALSAQDEYNKVIISELAIDEKILQANTKPELFTVKRVVNANVNEPSTTDVDATRMWVRIAFSCKIGCSDFSMPSNYSADESKYIALDNGFHDSESLPGLVMALIFAGISNNVRGMVADILRVAYFENHTYVATMRCTNNNEIIFNKIYPIDFIGFYNQYSAAYDLNSIYKFIEQHFYTKDHAASDMMHFLGACIKRHIDHQFDSKTNVLLKAIKYFADHKIDLVLIHDNIKALEPNASKWKQIKNYYFPTVERVGTTPLSSTRNKVCIRLFCNARESKAIIDLNSLTIDSLKQPRFVERMEWYCERKDLDKSAAAKTALALANSRYPKTWMALYRTYDYINESNFTTEVKVAAQHLLLGQPIPSHIDYGGNLLINERAEVNGVEPVLAANKTLKIAGKVNVDGGFVSAESIVVGNTAAVDGGVKNTVNALNTSLATEDQTQNESSLHMISRFLINTGSISANNLIMRHSHLLNFLGQISARRQLDVRSQSFNMLLSTMAAPRMQVRVEQSGQAFSLIFSDRLQYQSMLYKHKSLAVLPYFSPGETTTVSFADALWRIRERRRIDNAFTFLNLSQSLVLPYFPALTASLYVGRILAGTVSASMAIRTGKFKYWDERSDSEKFDLVHDLRSTAFDLYMVYDSADDFRTIMNGWNSLRVQQDQMSLDMVTQIYENAPGINDARELLTEQVERMQHFPDQIEPGLIWAFENPDSAFKYANNQIGRVFYVDHNFESFFAFESDQVNIGTAGTRRNIFSYMDSGSKQLYVNETYLSLGTSYDFGTHLNRSHVVHAVQHVTGARVATEYLKMRIGILTQSDQAYIDTGMNTDINVLHDCHLNGIGNLATGSVDVGGILHIETTADYQSDAVEVRATERIEHSGTWRYTSGFQVRTGHLQTSEQSSLHGDEGSTYNLNTKTVELNGTERHYFALYEVEQLPGQQALYLALSREKYQNISAEMLVVSTNSTENVVYAGMRADDAPFKLLTQGRVEMPSRGVSFENYQEAIEFEIQNPPPPPPPPEPEPLRVDVRRMQWGEIGELLPSCRPVVLNIYVRLYGVPPGGDPAVCTRETLAAMRNGYLLYRPDPTRQLSQHMQIVMRRQQQLQQLQQQQPQPTQSSKHKRHGFSKFFGHVENAFRAVRHDVSDVAYKVSGLALLASVAQPLIFIPVAIAGISIGASIEHREREHARRHLRAAEEEALLRAKRAHEIAEKLSHAREMDHMLNVALDLYRVQGINHTLPLKNIRADIHELYQRHRIAQQADFAQQIDGIRSSFAGKYSQINHSSKAGVSVGISTNVGTSGATLNIIGGVTTANGQTFRSDIPIHRHDFARPPITTTTSNASNTNINHPSTNRRENWRSEVNFRSNDPMSPFYVPERRSSVRIGEAQFFDITTDNTEKTLLFSSANERFFRSEFLADEHQYSNPFRTVNNHEAKSDAKLSSTESNIFSQILLHEQKLHLLERQKQFVENNHMTITNHEFANASFKHAYLQAKLKHDRLLPTYGRNSIQFHEQMDRLDAQEGLINRMQADIVRSDLEETIGARVFAQAKELNDLNRIMQSYVIQDIDIQINKLRTKLAFNEFALRRQQEGRSNANLTHQDFGSLSGLVLGVMARHSTSFLTAFNARHRDAMQIAGLAGLLAAPAIPAVIAVGAHSALSSNHAQTTMLHAFDRVMDMAGIDSYSRADIARSGVELLKIGLSGAAASRVPVQVRQAYEFGVSFSNTHEFRNPLIFNYNPDVVTLYSFPGQVFNVLRLRLPFKPVPDKRHIEYLSKVVKARPGVELIETASGGLHAYENFAQARAFAQIRCNLGEDTIPFLQKIGPKRNKFYTGTQSKDRSKGWRLDFDPSSDIKGAHINWWFNINNQKYKGTIRIEKMTNEIYNELLSHFPRYEP